MDKFSFSLPQRLFIPLGSKSESHRLETVMMMFTFSSSSTSVVSSWYGRRRGKKEGWGWIAPQTESVDRKQVDGSPIGWGGKLLTMWRHEGVIKSMSKLQCIFDTFTNHRFLSYNIHAIPHLSQEGVCSSIMGSFHWYCHTIRSPGEYQLYRPDLVINLWEWLAGWLLGSGLRGDQKLLSPRQDSSSFFGKHSQFTEDRRDS